MRRLGWLTAVLTLCWAWAAPAEAEAIRVEGRDRVAITSFDMLRDPTRALTIAEARDASFVPAEALSQDYSLGFTRDALWLKVDLLVTETAAGRYLLALDVPNFDRLEVWASWAGDGPLAAIGDRLPKLIPTRRHAAPIDLPAGRHTLWMRGATTGSFAVPLDLWRPEALWRLEQREVPLHAALTTVTIVLAVAGLLLAPALSSPATVFYAASALATTGYLVTMNGLDMLVLGGRILGQQNPFVWQVASGLFGIGFLLTALPLRRQRRWAIPMLGAAAAMALILLGFYYPFADAHSRPDVILRPRNLSLLILVAGVAASLQSRLAGHRPADYMIAGWLMLAAGNVLTALRNAGIVPWTDLTYYLPVYAPVLEMLFFGAMLASRVHQLRLEKEEARQDLLVALRRNEADLTRRVDERTAELDRALATLGRREAQLRRILEAAPFPILLCTAQPPGLLYGNRRARERFFGAADVTPPCSPADLFRAPADHDRLLEALEREGLADAVELEMQEASGRRFWATASLAAIEHEGRPAHLLAVSDISRRKQLEQELTKAKELAEAAAALERTAREAQRQFLAMVSHEFRTPLTVIAMAAQNLERGVEDAPTKDRLARIGRAVRYMNGMIDACLLDDRIEGAGLVLRPGTLDLAELVREVAGTIQASAPHHRLAITAQGSPPMQGDTQLLGIALSNLMENAVKYAPPGTIDIALSQEAHGALVTVADRGAGVPEEERERIFEKYHRCAATGGVPGAGLGLYLTRRIATAHGGTVSVRGRPGGGALFTLRLPGGSQTGLTGPEG